MKTHLAMPVTLSRQRCSVNTACGAWIEHMYREHLANDPKKVTCRRCLQTRAYREASQ